MQIAGAKVAVKMRAATIKCDGARQGTPPQLDNPELRALCEEEICRFGYL